MYSPPVAARSVQGANIAMIDHLSPRPKQPELRISKLDAARRQLDVAVRLYFNEDDPVAIHTLTAVAHQLLTDISKARRGAPILTEAFVEFVRPNKRGEARSILKSAANYFKHADRDAAETLVFKPSQTEVFLLDASLKYKELTGEIVPALAVYQAWFWLGPGWQLVDLTKTGIIERVRAAFPGATRRSFFKEALSMLLSIEE